MDITDKLSYSVGLRYDLFDNGVLPPLNPNFLARTGFSNRSTFKGRGVFQPRVALNWDATDRLIVRLGAGIFAGGTPDVFLSNVYSNTGQLTNAVDIARATCVAQGNSCSALNGITGGTIPANVVTYLTTNVASLAAAPTDVIDPRLHLANKFKASLQADYKAGLGPLGDNWMFGVQLLYDRTIQAYQWTDVRSVQLPAALPDGRARYAPIGGVATTNRDLMLTNTDDGRGIFATFRFEKTWDFGLGIEGSYTRSNVKDRSALTSSTSSSNYGNNAFVDPNIPAYGRSIYEYRNQYKFGFNYRHAFFGDARTSFGLFAELRSGRPYSVTMLDNTGTRGTVFGTVGNLGNMLLYVPNTTDAKVSFDTAANETAFNALVDKIGIGKYRGTILPKNSQTSPSFNKIDFHFGQEIPLPVVSGGKLELFADIENVLNLLNRKWGALRQVQFPYNASVVRVQCLSTPVATGTAPTAAQVNTSTAQSCVQYRYSNVAAPSEITQTRQSLYGIRVGVRVKF
jgi:hypothetical protein